MQLLRSRCVGDARNTLTDPGGAGLDGRRSRPFTGGHSLSTTRPTINHRIVGPETECHTKKGRVSSRRCATYTPCRRCQPCVMICEFVDGFVRAADAVTAGRAEEWGGGKKKKGGGLFNSACLHRIAYCRHLTAWATWRLGTRGSSHLLCLHRCWRYLVRVLAIYGRGTSSGWVRVPASLTRDFVSIILSVSLHATTRETG